MKILKTNILKNSEFNIFDVKSLMIDQTIDFDIYIKKNGGYVIIIESGTTITKNLYFMLQKQEKLYVLKNNGADYCKNLIYHIKQNKDYHKKCINILYESNDRLFKRFFESKENRIDMNSVKAIVDSIIYLVRYDKAYIKSLMPIFANSYELSYHSLHVSLYALSLGNILELDNEKMIKLGIAALLHDIGLKKIDPDIINKSTGLDADEIKTVRKHAQYGVDILLHNNIHDPYIIDAVMHHHERYDGQGYPNRIEKSEISDIASIIAICDVFDALTNDRPYRKSYSSFDALNMMMYDVSMINKFNLKYLILALKLL